MVDRALICSSDEAGIILQNFIKYLKRLDKSTQNKCNKLIHFHKKKYKYLFYCRNWSRLHSYILYFYYNIYK